MGHQNRFLPAEDEVIRRMWPDHTAAEIADNLKGRLPESVTTRGRALGLPSKARRIEFTDAQITNILQMHPTHTYKQIAEKYDVSIYVIYSIFADNKMARKKSGPPRGFRLARKHPSGEVLQPMELAPGHFAVDEFSYQTWRRILRNAVVS